jgi:TPR repeat protein
MVIDDISIVINVVIYNITILNYRQRIMVSFRWWRAAFYGNSNGRPDGTETTDVNQISRWQRGAESGDAIAQFRLGAAYFDGQGVPREYETALKWWLTAADQGNAPAQYYIGTMYENGTGVVQDYAVAINWYQKAAEGYALAQNSLGAIHARGRGVKQDYAEAANWYRKAAQRGCVEAQCNLALLYCAGDGVPLDQVMAYTWLSIAVENGLNLTEPRRKKYRSYIFYYLLAMILNKEQIALARTRATEWFNAER